MYSARAVFTFPQGTAASTQFALLRELAYLCESIETTSGLPAFEIEASPDKCSVVCYRPDKWKLAASFLKQAHLEGTVTVVRPEDL
jgi:hypothetical protein